MKELELIEILKSDNKKEELGKMFSAKDQQDISGSGASIEQHLNPKQQNVSKVDHSQTLSPSPTPNIKPEQKKELTSKGI